MPGITSGSTSCGWSLARTRFDFELDKSRPSFVRPPNNKTPAPMIASKVVWLSSREATAPGSGGGFLQQPASAGSETTNWRSPAIARISNLGRGWDMIAPQP
jgi:hypothetical protein